MPTKILIISNCRLGDSLMMIPALKILRQAYPDCRITFTSESATRGIVAAKEILGGRNLVDSFIELNPYMNKFKRLWQRLIWLLRMRTTHWNLGIVLIPPSPPATMFYIHNLRRYLRLCGIKKILAPEKIHLHEKDSTGNLLPMPHVIDQLLGILRPLGIPLPPPGQADATLPPLIHGHECPVRLDCQRKYLAVACGSNMSTKLWPVKKYAEVLTILSQRHDFIPVYFGGLNDAERCHQLHEQVPGIPIINHPISDVESVMRHCIGYLGNDTGLIHMAAAVGLRCVGVYSNQNAPELWAPYTANRGILRPPSCSCAGCLLATCTKKKEGCIAAITVKEVLNMCEHMFFQSMQTLIQTHDSEL